MQIVNLPELYINQAVEAFKAGGLVIFPTETVYGAGVLATSNEAIKRLSDFKKRPLGKPYSIAVADQEMAERYVVLNDMARNIYKNFLPGPVTVISKGKNKVATGVQSESGTLGVRIPDYPILMEILRVLDGPITATSANPSYGRRPYSIDDVLAQLSEKQKALIDLIIDAGTLPRREPSTVIDTTMDDTAILRNGGQISSLNSQFSIISRSEEDTKNCGKELWQKYEQYLGQRAIVFALSGEMGAGKTQFAKGMALAMGITETITSPTYSLQEEYGKLVHIDAWRMQAPQELEDLGMKGNIHDKAVMVIEWAERVEEVIRKYNEEAVIVWVRLEYSEKENERKISWRGV